MTPTHETADTGARREKLTASKLRFDLLLSNDEALRRLAATWAEGFAKYGADNWQKGFPASELINHAFEHIAAHCVGDKSEDHLAHACWNLMALMWEEKNRPELIDYPLCNVAKETQRLEAELGSTVPAVPLEQRNKIMQCQTGPETFEPDSNGTLCKFCRMRKENHRPV